MVVMAAAAAAAAEAARILVEQANARMATAVTGDSTRHGRRMSNSLQAGRPNHDEEGSSKDEENSTTSTATLPNLQSVLPPQWPDRPPLYLGPMVASAHDAVGGGRGYVATRNLQPGTLLLAERPIWTWPPEQHRRELSFLSILSIFRHADAPRIVRDMELLHPTMEVVDRYLDDRIICNRDISTCSDDGDGGSNSTGRNCNINIDQIDKMMMEMENKHGKNALLQDILDVSKRRSITRSDDKTVEATDLYRMLLALRYNGFETGVYLHFAIFNHDDDPNCIKFAPEDGTAPPHTPQAGRSSGANDGVLASCSEVRTTRFVKRGEALTMSYLNPREVSHATRRRHLWDQHRFDIGNVADLSKARQFELVCGAIPKSSKDHRYDDTTHRIENVISELEEQMDEIKDAFATENFVLDHIERAKAIEVAASLELIATATQQLGNANHILMVRCYRLHLDASEALLKADVAAGLSSSQRNGVVCRFVETARKLLDLQLLYLGDHHVDVGRTYHDLAQGINTLLSHSPSDLFDLNLAGMMNFAQCAKEEHRYQREYERIHALYPTKVVDMFERKN
mmetsp:Transcript_4384/g.9890  ORF Transcript_4384/g.9890 Transcript_4384/m.9890 type:complete len:570 (+) Transcript_4384:292-2001(+)